ncbi:hypothetical protein GGR54DRAFT_647257 [Hypoxylon sp. NC1633]|nr:hypothetical protein GGR54DRAFT_647257 [Hypoxylon sp. NC1633]
MMDTFDDNFLNFQVLDKNLLWSQRDLPASTASNAIEPKSNHKDDFKLEPDGRLEEEQFRDLAVRGVLPVATESVAIRFCVAQNGYLINALKLPANYVVIGPKGPLHPMTLPEAGLYTVCYPKHSYPRFNNAVEWMVCANTPIKPLHIDNDGGYPGAPSQVFLEPKEMAAQLLAGALEEQQSSGGSNTAFVRERKIDLDPPTISFGPQLPLQPRDDATGLLTDLQDEQVQALRRVEGDEVLQVRLPKRYILKSPSGRLMTFDHGPARDENGQVKPGFGGVYSVVPATSLAKEKHGLWQQEVEDHDVALMVFREPMAVFRDHHMLPRLLQGGLHLLSLCNDTVKVFSPLGVYDLTSPLPERIPPGQAITLPERILPGQATKAPKPRGRGRPRKEPAVQAPQPQHQEQPLKNETKGGDLAGDLD